MRMSLPALKAKELPKARIPGPEPLPGARIAPVLNVVAPPMVPEPAKVAPEATDTAPVAAEKLPSTCNVPAFTLVVPV